MTAQRKTVCRAVAAELERTIRKWDSEKAMSYWFRKGPAREGVIAPLTHALMMNSNWFPSSSRRPFRYFSAHC